MAPNEKAPNKMVWDNRDKQSRCKKRMCRRRPTYAVYLQYIPSVKLTVGLSSFFTFEYLCIQIFVWLKVYDNIAKQLDPLPQSWSFRDIYTGKKCFKWVHKRIILRFSIFTIQPSIHSQTMIEYFKNVNLFNARLGWQDAP